MHDDDHRSRTRAARLHAGAPGEDDHHIFPKVLLLFLDAASEAFTGRKGVFVKLADTIRGFREIVEGRMDEVPEQAFYMMGTIEDVVENAKRMAA